MHTAIRCHSTQTNIGRRKSGSGLAHHRTGSRRSSDRRSAGSDPRTLILAGTPPSQTALPARWTSLTAPKVVRCIQRANGGEADRGQTSHYGARTIVHLHLPLYPRCGAPKRMALRRRASLTLMLAVPRPRATQSPSIPPSTTSIRQSCQIQPKAT